MPYKNKEDLKKYRKEYRQKYPEKRKEQDKKYYQKHIERIKEYQKIYRKNNLKKGRERSLQWRKDNPKKAKEIEKRYRKNNSEKMKEYYKNNRERILKQNKQNNKKNPEKRRSYINNYFKIKRKTDLKFNLNSRMSFMIWKALKENKAGRSWESLVGYRLNELIKRLGKNMPQGYTWQEYMNGDLHIDHIIPISAFNFTRPEHTDFKRCWALNNLRLLPARENLIKHNHLDRPFQPALKI